MAHIQLSVPDVSCNHCRMVVQGALSEVAGLTHIEVDLEAKRVDFDLKDPALLTEALEKLEHEDFPATVLKGP